MRIKIIPATIDDVDALVAIQKQAFKRLYDIYHDEGSPYLRGADAMSDLNMAGGIVEVRGIKNAKRTRNDGFDFRRCQS